MPEVRETGRAEGAVLQLLRISDQTGGSEEIS